MSATIRVEEVPRDTTLLVTVRDRDEADDREAILIRTDEGLRCWVNACRHFTDVPLDRGDGAETRNGEILCTEHGAMFDAASGLCTHGPCEEAVLPEVAVAVEDDEVAVVDDRYALVARGGVGDDDGMPASTSPREF